MKQKIYIILSILVTIAIMSYLFRIVSVKEVLSTIRNISLTPFLCFVVLSFGHTFFQTWRYLILLDVNNEKVSFITMFLVTTVRNLFSDLFPARIGTLSYVYILTNRLGIALEKALPSFFIAFIFDIIAIIPLLLISVSIIGWTFFGKLQLLIPISLGMLIILLVVLRFLPELFKITAKTCQRFTLLHKIEDKLNKTSIEIEQVKNSRIYPRVFTLSLSVRLCKYAKLYFLLLAILSIWGYGWKEIGFGRFFLGVCGAEFSASLPISGIAAFGAYEGTWALIFTMLGFPKKLAITTGISHHLITQIFGYSLGIIALIILLLPLFKAKKLTSKGISSTGLFIMRFVMSVLIICISLVFIYQSKNLVFKKNTIPENIPPTILSKGTEPKKLNYLNMITDSERKSLNSLAKKIKGEIVYTRNGRIRKIVIGNWNVIDLGEGEFVRWGPSGKRIAIYNKGEIHVMKADGTGRKKVVSVKGKIEHCPIEFHTNGEEIIYIRPGEGLYTVRINDGTTKRLEMSKKFNGEPGISVDGKRLVARYGHDLYAIDLSTGDLRKYGRGCSSGVSPDGEYLMYNLGKHREMVISSWDGKKQIKINSKTCEPDKRWDNHHWSNHNDYIAAQGSGKFREAYVFCISKNLGTRITWEGKTLYPDLFVESCKGG